MLVKPQSISLSLDRQDEKRWLFAAAAGSIERNAHAATIRATIVV
jgi:hypothetical protein